MMTAALVARNIIGQGSYDPRRGLHIDAEYHAGFRHLRSTMTSMRPLSPAPSVPKCPPQLISESDTWQKDVFLTTVHRGLRIGPSKRDSSAGLCLNSFLGT